MFLKSLIIADGDGTVIRDIPFHAGLNLIVDETPESRDKETGNSVGKTTVLKLIDFCLGGNAKDIYSDPENKNNEYRLVKDFLIARRASVTLVLTEDLERAEAREIRIERNFLPRRAKIQRINGEEKTDDAFEEGLTAILFPSHYGRKPTFRQIISHNIRHTDESVNNTLHTLDRYSRADEYETLYLFLLGCDFSKGDVKQEVRTKIDLEEKFRRRLEAVQTRSGYEGMLTQVNEDIRKVEIRRADMNVNPVLEADVSKLNQVRYEINVTTSEIGRLELRRDLLTQTEREIGSDKAEIDVNELRRFYSEATALVAGVQKQFEELYAFHNEMVASRIRFVVEELPFIADLIGQERNRLKELLAQEKTLAQAVTRTDSFAVLEVLIGEQNRLFQQKGDFENTIRQLNEVEQRLVALNAELAAIDAELFSDDFGQHLRAQLAKFNRYFAEVADELYGERYVLKADRRIVRGRPVYSFSTFSNNFSSGKKQGEISCFDIAYTLFADDEGIACLHFLLSDKKELMHDNQLVKIAQLVKARNIQFVASILQDKLPPELRQDGDIILRLSQKDKLFRIEAEVK